MALANRRAVSWPFLHLNRRTDISALLFPACNPSEWKQILPDGCLNPSSGCVRCQRCHNTPSHCVTQEVKDRACFLKLLHVLFLGGFFAQFWRNVFFLVFFTSWIYCIRFDKPSKLAAVDQRGANCGAQAKCGPLSFTIGPPELGDTVLIASR